MQTVVYLADIYGSQIYSILSYIDEDPWMASPIVPENPAIRAQIKHAVLEEEALTVNDFLFRRSLIWSGAYAGSGCRGRDSARNGLAAKMEQRRKAKTNPGI